MSPTTAAPPRPRPLGRGTMSRRLILRVAALVALITITLDATSLVIVRRVALEGLDAELRTALNQPVQLMPEASSWATNGLDVSIVNLKVQRAVVARDGQTIFLSLSQVEVLRQAANARTTTVGGRSAGIATVTVPAVGDYRIVRTTTGPQERIVGLSMDGFNAMMSRLLIIEAFLTVGAVLLAAAVVAAVVRVTLRPLTRLAQTASAVATMPLDRGEVNLVTRVGAPGADPASEVGRVGLALNTMLDNVEHALDSRQRSETQVRQFVADASHELRNPLAAIRGYAELTGRHVGALPVEDAFALGRIEAESLRMSKLVENLLLLARLDNGQAPGFTPVDAGEVLANAVADAQVTGPDHVWRLHLPEEPLLVWADANQLQQVFGNLLANARKHTPPGTRVEAAARADLAAGRVVVSVSDDGPGIAEGLVDHVFERFTRADVARTHDAEGSAGLGLAIVAAVVGAHRGAVGVESTPGQTRFTVTLPACQAT